MMRRAPRIPIGGVLLFVALVGRGGDVSGADEPAAASPTADERAAAAALDAAGASLRINGQYQIVSVTLSNGDAVTEDLLAHIGRLKTLQSLVVAGPKVSDDALKHFEGLTQLTTCYLRDTAATDEGIARLQAALPKCAVRRMRSAAGPGGVPGGFRGRPDNAAQIAAARAAAQAAGAAGGGFAGGPAAADPFGATTNSSPNFVPNGLVRELLRTDVQIEIELTSQQWDEVQSMLADASATTEDLLRKMRDVIRESATAEQPQRRAEVQAEIEKLATAADERLRALLSAEQYHRLEQLAWHRSGPAILLDAEFTADLKLDDTQRARINEVRNLRSEDLPAPSNDQSRARSARSLFFTIGASCEKILAALTDEQRTAYEEKLGPPLEADEKRIAQHVFALLDTDSDEQLTADEWQSADASRLLSAWRNRNRVELPLTREDFVQGFVAARAASRSRAVPSF